ncbi:MAG: hydrogenase maturation protease [Candidatus Marinimicrobia bacterium]|nr:hydrogenase maturation protease [Candidatus Neomarinimicrobiota bacterium]
MAELTIIGIGNRLRGDDALGPVLIDKLREVDWPEVELVDIGSDAIGLLEHLEDRHKVWIVDVCQMGRTPGSIVKFDPEDADMVLDQDPLSLHGLGLAETIRMARSLQMVPEEFKIIGVEPDSIQFNTQLSQAVQQAMETIVKEISLELQHAAGKPQILL